MVAASGESNSMFSETGLFTGTNAGVSQPAYVPVPALLALPAFLPVAVAATGGSQYAILDAMAQAFSKTVYESSATTCFARFIHDLRTVNPTQVS